MRSKADEVTSLIELTVQKRKNEDKLKTKPSSLEETVRATVRESSPAGRSETTGGGFVKEVGFKPRVKERE